jgi:iron complex outermembrane recepter protein
MTIDAAVRRVILGTATALALAGAGATCAQEPPAASATAPAASDPAAELESIIVTANRREERLQDVPLPVSVVGGDFAADAGAFNVGRLKELVPTVQFYSTNPRNTAVNIRGLGSPFGLTNDGLEQGVGFYVDGVYFARPAAATLDFIDIERIEVLRGPQGTLYGKNTTAGAISITTRRPEFTTGADVELSYGNYGFVQAKASITGPLSEHIAGRLSFSGTQRDGVLYNVRTQDDVNDLNNLGVAGQLLFEASDSLKVRLAGDVTRQRPEGYAQVVAGVAPTLRAANRQYAALAARLNYAPPSFNAFDRLTDTDTPWRSKQDLGGASLTVDWTVGIGTLTSITAWRYWDWDPSNDRDFLGLPITTISAAPSKQRQWTQEVRYAGDVNDRLSFVTGVFGFRQTVDSDPFQLQQQGSAAAVFLLAPSANASTPGLLDGYGQRLTSLLDTESAAVFGQLEWKLTDSLRVLPGLRVNYDKKEAVYRNEIYGGLQTTNAALLALQRSILAPQAYTAANDDTDLSGQFTVAWSVNPDINLFATYAKGYKSLGLNIAGLPTDAAGNPALGAATVRPEDVDHYELGIKTQPLPGVTANLTLFNTEIGDYQAQVVNASVGVLRGYLANAEKVRVRGAEFDATARVGEWLNLYASAAYTDGKYVSFRDAPPPLELTGGPQVFDASGTRLPGLSKWAAAAGGEFRKPTSLLGKAGDVFFATDVSYRSEFSSNPTESRFLNVSGYGLANVRVGFRDDDGWDLFLWSRNVTAKDYYELLSAAPGGTGLYVGLPSDPRTWGLTFRASL